ncbi:hypothetical protein [Flavihumibacter sp. CACIAM 22H1]|uniref:hypothetical protein n=1 Tax=Flavihumibacter sp. CACIAM 22H1 TaxID=1812911 RepID=UPI0007A8BA07|nr:hypothetical protein [Flavihumibacter sp. CACIAM 22H1]KYP16177.1 MAG: hypothetical protein A1D16_14020 [Flavihumibacter sp. CACIAM 22H1]
MKHLVSLCALLLTAVCGNCQDLETVEVDSISLVPRKTIPFDKPFYLKFRTDELPVSVYIIEHVGSRGWTGTIHHALDKRKPYELEAIPPANYRMVEEGGKKYLLIKFGEHPISYESKKVRRSWFGKKEDRYVLVKPKNNILKPRKSYTIILNKISKEGIAVFDLLAEGKTLESQKRRAEIATLSEQKFGLEYYIPTDGKIATLYTSSLKTFYDKIATSKQIISQPTNEFKNFVESKGLKDLKNSLTIKKNLDVLAMLMDVKQLRLELTILGNLTSQEQSDLLNGMVSLENVNGKMETNKTKQLANVESTLQKMNRVQELADIATTRGWVTFESTWYDGKNSYLKKVISTIEGNLTAEKDIKEQYVQIEKTIIEKEKFFDPQIITGNSYVYNLETRSKFQLSPDFGYVVYGFQKGFTSFTPYLGFQVNFRSIDRDIPFSIFKGLNKYPNKTFWHYLSFMTGWSLSKTSEANKREDFFESGSLLTGIGLRLTNSVKITCGNLWFYKLDARPEVKGRKLAITPFVSLSLDLSLKSLMNDITSLKPSK